MFEDVVICEMYHSDPLGNEYCNPNKVGLGEVQNGIMLQLEFPNLGLHKTTYANGDRPLQITTEVLADDKIEIKNKYDIQEGCKISITDTIEIYDLIIGSSGNHFHYFTNLPAINNTTDFGDTIFLTFVHTIEGFTFISTPKTFN